LADALDLAGAAREGFLAAAQPAPRRGGPAPAPARAPAPAPGNLPAPLTSFVGRERELARAAALLRGGGVRLLTLTGPPGVGKTRLAVALATTLGDAFPAGAGFVPLSAVADPTMLLPAVAAALGVPEPRGGGPALDALAAHLAGQRVLLVLDNLEQLTAAATAVAELLARCPELTVVTTSRAPLRVRGEREFPVPPLRLPAAGPDAAPAAVAASPAVALFLARARDVRPDLAPTDDDLAAVAEVCRRLDGLPLALELAAARVKLLPPRALLARLAPALPLLTGGARDLPARQRTLRDAIAWSYDLLAPAERAVFRGLGVFAGGCTPEAAAAVAARDDRPGGVPATLDLLGALLDGSLLQRASGRGDGPRLALLETVREYALERLAGAGELEAARARHAAYFLAFAERAAARLHGPEQAAWLDALAADEPNLRAALRWAVDGGDAARGVRLGAALWWYWHVRGAFAEGRAWLAALLDLPDPAGAVPAAARVHALVGAGLLAEFGAGRTARRETERRLSEALALARRAGDRQGEALARTAWGLLAVHDGDAPRARPRLRRARALARRIADDHLTAFAANALGVVASRAHELEAAEALLTEALTLRRRIGDEWGVAASLNDLGRLALARDDPAAARAHFTAALAIRRRHGNRPGIALSLRDLGHVASGEGDHEGAGRYYAQTLAIALELGDRAGAANAMMFLGLQAYHRGAYDVARPAYEASLAIWRELGDRRSTAELLRLLGLVACARREFAAAIAAHAASLALRREVGDRYGVAECLLSLGDPVREGGDDARAVTLFRESLAIFADLGSKRMMAVCLVKLAGALGATGEPLRAARLLGAGEAGLACLGAGLWPADRAAAEATGAALGAALGPEPLAAARAAGRTLSLEAAARLGLAAAGGAPARALRLAAASPAPQAAGGHRPLSRGGDAGPRGAGP
jgi:predicted ATPase